jgi:CBS domain-containing protein
MALLVRQAMTEAPETATPDMSAADAAQLMRKVDTGVIPVAEGDQLRGLVTDRDIVVRVVAERNDPDEVRLSDIMTESTVTIAPDDPLSDARDLMAERRIRRLPVIEGGRLVGIVSMGDIAVHDESKSEVGQTLEDVSESESTRDLNT